MTLACGTPRARAQVRFVDGVVAELRGVSESGLLLPQHEHDHLFREEYSCPYYPGALQGFDHAVLAAAAAPAGCISAHALRPRLGRLPCARLPCARAGGVSCAAMIARVARAGQLVKFKSYSALHSARVRVLSGGAAVRALRGTVLAVAADELGVEWQAPATGAPRTARFVQGRAGRQRLVWFGAERRLHATGGPPAPAPWRAADLPAACLLWGSQRLAQPWGVARGPATRRRVCCEARSLGSDACTCVVRGECPADFAA